VPDCSDGVKNNGETGMDCGGPICTACAVGKGCIIDSDCISKKCSGLDLCE
jgi:hypothetical protein